jgi:4-nitrophenyl phosphatase
LHADGVDSFLMLPSTVTALILDMDGVLWRDASPIGNLPKIFTKIRDRGLKFAFATNNSTKTPEGFKEIMATFGVDLESWQIITSSLATAEILAREYPDGGSVYVIGEAGILTALEQNNFNPISDPHDETRPVAVVAGFDRLCSYDKLRRGTLLIRSGVPFFGTNPDKTFPSPEGLVPGAGALQAAITAATDVEPRVIGKPSPYLMQTALERLGSKSADTLVIGDRLETDIVAGQAAGCRTALVLSGVSTREQAETWAPAADIIADDLATLID